jgi:STE24 endopeptidase
MNMKKMRVAVVAAWVALMIAVSSSALAAQAPQAASNAATGQVQSQQPAQNSAPPTQDKEEQPKLKITAYTLPPDLAPKARHLAKVRFAFDMIAPLYGLIVLWFVLEWGLAPKYRDWAEKNSARLVAQAVIFTPLILLTIDILELPTGIFDHRELRKYGLSVQGWASWAADWGKTEIIEIILGTILISILYAVIRRSPRRWWFYFWLAALALGIFMVFLEPLVIDPMFHTFVPLQQKDPELVMALEKMVRRAGRDIPPQRMFWMNASEKSNELNAYVTGIGSSKRIVVWDTTTAKMTTSEIVFVTGHEMGHYVLNHIPKEVGILAIGLFIFFYVTYRLMGWMLRRWGSRWRIRDLNDWGSFPALLLLLSILSFIATPVSNAVSRHFEHQADQYGLEVTHGLTPDSGQVAAQAFQVLGEVDLSDPDPSRLDILLTYDHPSIPDRVRYCLRYDPWANGGHGEFVH